MILLVAYVATILAANWMLVTFGVWRIGWLDVPSGVLVAGLAFTFRDYVQAQLGRRWSIAAILVGSACSAVLSGPLALASGAAFLVSELLDMVVYERVRRRGFEPAVRSSNYVGLVVDSVAFLLLGALAVPFLSITQLPGLVIGKWAITEMTLLARRGWREVLPRLAHA